MTQTATWILAVALSLANISCGHLTHTNSIQQLLTNKLSCLASDNLAHLSWTAEEPCYRNGPRNYCVFSDFGNLDLSVVTTPGRASSVLDAAQRPGIDDQHNDCFRGTEKDCEVVILPGKGFGVISKRAFYPGQTIFSEVPSILVDLRAQDDVPTDTLCLFEEEAADHLSPTRGHHLRSLHRHSDGKGPSSDDDSRDVSMGDHCAGIHAIMAGNCFGVSLEENGMIDFQALFLNMSRLNHDCRPNAGFYLDAATLTMHVHAVRSISPGEEITVSYISPTTIREQRRQMLREVWGFDCSCSTCAARDPFLKASDGRTRHLRALYTELTSAGGAHTPDVAELYLSLQRQERLDVVIYEGYRFAAIEWNGLGESWKSVRYARLAIEAGLSTLGPNHPITLDMEELVQNPMRHWSWMTRMAGGIRVKV